MNVWKELKGTIGPYWTISTLFNQLEELSKSTENMTRENITRLCAQFLSDFEHLSHKDRIEALKKPSESVSEERLDILLGAVAEHAALTIGITPPKWSQEQGEGLFPSWFFAENDNLKAYLIQNTPPSFSARGIYIEDRSLKSV